MILYGRPNFLRICDLQQYCVETFYRPFGLVRILQAYKTGVFFSQNTSEICSQIPVKVVHKYKWKFARKHLHSLTIETEIGPWSRLLLLQLARNVASLFDPDSKYFSTPLLVLNTFLPDINYSATFNILAKSPLDIIPCFWQGRKPYSKCWCWITKEILMVSNCLSKLLFLGADPHVFLRRTAAPWRDVELKKKEVTALSCWQSLRTTRRRR